MVAELRPPPPAPSSSSAIRGAISAFAEACARGFGRDTSEGPASAPGAVPAVAEDAYEKLAVWLDLLTTWNRTHDLTAARGPEELMDLMLADAFLLSGRIAEGARVVDVGSGAGAPGLPLALLRPDLKVTLVEPLSKRAAFLRTCIGTLDRLDVELLQKKGEDLPSGGWEVAISRATLPPPAWLALGGRLIGDLPHAPARSVWALLAKEQPPAAPGLSLAYEVAYVWPATSAARRAARYDGRAA